MIKCRIFQQIAASIDQRLARLEQSLHDEPNFLNSSDGEIRERFDIVEGLKHQVKVKILFPEIKIIHLYLHRIILINNVIFLTIFINV
jgi:hypothetical protein